ncbi:stage II sporulation protein R [Neobacillus sp. SM06]|uniref:stage II sporulation protein R n=1 Tax=Neobacillus sp. SM06 TaxID=3422492 RepID=UPI003D2E55E7
MRRKTIVWAYLVVLSLGTIFSLYIPKNEVTAKEAVTIPGDAIRLRILANSDLKSDQDLKIKVRDAVNAKITGWVQDLTSKDEAKKAIQSHIPELKATAEETVKREGSNQAVKVEFGKVQFPTKLYGEFLYPAGTYEALLITLGEGKGANWWCVLFPPLCFLDFSNSTAVSAGPANEKAVQGKKEESGAAKDQEAAAAKEQEKQSAEQAPPVQKEDSPKVLSQGQPLQEKSQQAKPQQVEKKPAQKGEQAQKPKQEKAPAKAENQVQPASKVDAEPQAKIESEEQTGLSTPPLAKQETVLDQTGNEQKQKAPVYTPQDEEPVKVKFFVVELWEKLFH